MLSHSIRLAVVLFGTILLLVTCQRSRELQPLGQYYGYQRTDDITLKLVGNRKPEVLLTVDLDSLHFSATAVGRDNKEIPNAVYTYWVNGKRLPNNTFLPDQEGEHKVVATLGEKASDTLIIKAIEPKRLVKRLVLMLTNGDPKLVFSDGTSSLSFSMVALGFDEKPVPFDYSKGLTFQINGQPSASLTIRPTVEKIYRFKVTGYEMTSNEIVVEAHPRSYYVGSLRLKTVMNGTDFIADEISVAMFSIEVLDRESKWITFDYSNDLKFYVNDQPSPTLSFKTRTPGVYRFKAKLYDKETSEYTLRALSLSEANIITMPIVFHLLDVDIPQAKLQAQIDILNNTFRDNWNPENGPKAERHADLRLRFVLADRDPNGNIMNSPGRDFIRKGRTEYSAVEVGETIGWLHYWNPDYYLNVFVANFTDPSSVLGTSWTGRAYFPTVSQSLVGLGTAPKGIAPVYLYCTYLKPVVFNHDYYSTTLTHEIGHMLGLAHAYNETDCIGDVDWCDDTPVYNRSGYSENQRDKQRVSCAGQTFPSTNYMDYHYSYWNSFTLDQAIRARHVINYGLWLPTPFNGRTISGGRQSAPPGYVQRPAVVANVKPVACVMPSNGPRSFGWPMLPNRSSQP